MPHKKHPSQLQEDVGLAKPTNRTSKPPTHYSPQHTNANQVFIAIASVIIGLSVGWIGLQLRRRGSYVYSTETLGFNPQFIVITHDDEVNTLSTSLLATITQGHSQHNGCPLPVTWFTLSDGSECEKIRERWALGDEIGAHTISHIELSMNTSKTTVQEEIYGSRKFLTTTCGIPGHDVVGFRAPFLTTTPIVRQTLHSANFLYDASAVRNLKEEDIPIKATKPYELSNGLDRKHCDSVYRPCDPDEGYPGLWEVPVWTLMYKGSRYAMDPGKDSQGNGGAHPAYEVLKSNFDAVYTGNRAPFPIYVHSPWFEKSDSVSGTREFIKYALSHPDVYFVTIRQLIEWTKLSEFLHPTEFPSWLASKCGQPFI